MKVILTGRESHDRWEEAVPFDVKPYSADKAWPTQRNVYNVSDDQYHRWVRAKKEYDRMQTEIRDLIRNRSPFS